MSGGCSINKLAGCLVTTSDNCVMYTGDPIPSLGICTGQPLSEVEAIILTKILEFTESTTEDGGGIPIEDLVQACAYVSNRTTGQPNTLKTFIQVLLDIACDTDTRLKTLENSSDTYDVSCIDPLTNDTKGVVQALITKVCQLATSVQALSNQIINNSLSTTIDSRAGNILRNGITTCGGWNTLKTGSGETTQVTFFGFVPPYCPIPCYAPLSWFDNTGKGIDGTPVCGYFICNGNNGTPDWRGFTPASAVNFPGINAGPLNSLITANNNPTQLLNIGFKEGTRLQHLTIQNVPAHTHAFTVPPHSHNFTLTNIFASASSPNPPVYAKTNNNNPSNFTTEQAGGGTFTSSSAGGSTPVVMMQPTVYCYFIMRFPEKPIWVPALDGLSSPVTTITTN